MLFTPFVLQKLSAEGLGDLHRYDPDNHKVDRVINAVQNVISFLAINFLVAPFWCQSFGDVSLYVLSYYFSSDLVA